MNLTNLLIAVKNHELNITDIASLDVNNIIKIILTSAYYEVNNLDNLGIKYLKMQSQNTLTTNNLKIINSLMERNKQKKKLFFTDYYINLLKMATTSKTIKKEEQPAYFKDIKDLFTNNDLWGVINYIDALPVNKFTTSPQILYYKALAFFKLGRPNTALNICHQTNIKDDNLIKKLEIEIYSFLGDFAKVSAIGNNNRFKNDINIQIQYLKFLYQQKRYSQIIAICSNLASLKNSSMILWYKMLSLIALSRLEEALSICEMPLLKNNRYFQEKRIEILYFLERYDEALSICHQEELDNSFKAKHFEIEILYLKGDYEKVKEYATDPFYQNDYIAQYYYLLILIAENRRELILNVLTNKNLLNYNPIRIIKERIELEYQRMLLITLKERKTELTLKKVISKND